MNEFMLKGFGLSSSLRANNRSREKYQVFIPRTATRGSHRSIATSIGSPLKIQFTADQPVAKIKGQTIVWPKSAGFVHVTESGGLSEALTSTLLPFRRDRLSEAVCIEAAPITMSAAPNASMALESARQSRWQSLVTIARDEKDPAAQRTRTREAVRAITVQRQEEIQKTGYFVTNRRPH
jgi:hypothetical protein